MKFVRAVSVLAVSAFAFAACDNGSDDVVIADFEGSWDASQFEYEDDTGDAPGFGIDAISDAGGSVSLDVEADGSFTGTINIPGLTPQELPIGGTISLVSSNGNQGEIHIDFNQTTESYGLFGDFNATFTLVGDELEFINHSTMFDFPDSVEEAVLGAARGPVAATLTVTVHRD